VIFRYHKTGMIKMGKAQCQGQAQVQLWRPDLRSGLRARPKIVPKARPKIGPRTRPKIVPKCQTQDCARVPDPRLGPKTRPKFGLSVRSKIVSESQIQD
jgi:hypothetical protein